MQNVNLLNHNVGISQILEHSAQGHIPTAKPLASSVVNEAGLAEHFSTDNVQSNLAKSLAPNLGDGEILRPDIFNQTINSVITKLESSENSQVQNLLKDILKPLSENKELLNAYTGLMIGG